MTGVLLVSASALAVASTIAVVLYRRFTGPSRDGGVPWAPLKVWDVIAAYTGGTIPFVLQDMAQKVDGPAYRFPYPVNAAVYVVRDLEVVRQILLDPATVKPYSMHRNLDQIFSGKNVFTAQDDDPRWAHARHSILGALGRTQPRIGAVATKLAEEFLAAKVKPLAAQGGSFDPRREFATMFMREIIEAGFEYEGTQDEVAAVFEKMETARQELFVHRIKNPVRGALPFFSADARAGGQANRDVHAFARRILDSYRAKTDKASETTVIKAMIASGQYKGDADLVADLVTLFGGPQSAGIHVAFVLLELARHPDVRSRLRAELRVLRAKGEDLGTSPLLAQVLRETNRLHPVNAISSIRQVGRDFPLGDGRTRIPSGAIVYAAQYVINRDRAVYPDPERFDPDRWAEPVAASRAAALMPFSIGKRDCLGQLLAEIGWNTIIPRLIIDHDFEIAQGGNEQFGFFLEPAGLAFSVEGAT